MNKLEFRMDIPAVTREYTPSNPGIEPGSPALQADTLPSEPPGKLQWVFYLCAKHTFDQLTL